MSEEEKVFEFGEELFRRKLIRSSLAEWARWRGFEPALHHLVIIREVESFLESPTDEVLLLHAPPGSAKSTYISVLLPSWYLSNHHSNNILFATHSMEFAERWGRRVRNDIALETSTLGIELAADSQAACRWALATGAEYYAVGAGVGISGFRADLGVVDDLFGSREDAYSELVRRKRWDWYNDDFGPRLKPGAKRILMNCLTGDTRVLLATGGEKLLRDIRPGDLVATYENGGISVSRVRNWANNGPDRVFTIRMKSGIIVKANGRHPFLVEEDGETKWRRTATLKRGSGLIRVIGASGMASHALRKDVASQPSAKACVNRTTTSIGGQPASALLQLTLAQDVRRICATAMELVLRNMSVFWPSKAAYVPSVSNLLQREIPALTGTGSFASITATTTKRSGDFSATTAILPLVTERLKRFLLPPLSMCEVSVDTVLEVVESGTEDVFDVEIERTENFIANGLVSHNTRWHEEDVAGRVHDQITSGIIKGRIINITAIAEENDVLHRVPGEWLWDDPKGYDYASFLRARHRETSPMMWAALYQQKPAPEEGDYFKAEWLHEYSIPPPREHLYVYGASDYAVTADGGDWTVHIVVGLDPDGRMYVLDLWRGQKDSSVWVDAYCDLVNEWKPLLWAEEKGQIAASIGPYLMRRALERRAYCARQQFASKYDKAIRAQSIRGRMAMQGLYLPANKLWAQELRRELLSVWAGKHDDQADALGLIGQLLDTMVSGKVVQLPVRKREKDYITKERGDYGRSGSLITL